MFLNTRKSKLFFVFIIVVTISTVTACGGGGDGQTVAAPLTPAALQPTENTATIYRMPTYDVTETINVKYGEGLTHATWNTEPSQTMDLLLDIYQPENGIKKRPVVVFIHGGGFRGGDKSFSEASNMMHFFAERGFVGFSINYRLLDDFGTIPTNVNAIVDNLSQLSINERDQIKAIYPATRDAKAAIRWIYKNAEELGVDTDHVTAIGGSAGAFISIALGVTKPSDYVDEISERLDSTILQINRDQSATVHTVINHWGGGEAADLLENLDGESRWDATDAPISIVHGTEDLTVSFDSAEYLRDVYTQTGVPFVYYPLEGEGHSPWGAIVDGKSLSELALDFILQTQELNIIE